MGSPPGARRPLRLLSVVIPARDEEGSLAATLAQVGGELEARGIPHELVVVDDGSADGTWKLLADMRARLPRLRPFRNEGEHGYGRAVVHGLDRMEGDAAVIVMADGSDDGRDVAGYWEKLEEGYDCVFGSRFAAGARLDGYPRRRLALNRLFNRSLMILFGFGCDDVTNAFKAYRREVIEACRPFTAAHFDLTVELPLKAFIRGFAWTTIPVSWRNRRAGRAKLRVASMAPRYLARCLELWREKRRGRRPSPGRGGETAPSGEAP